MSPEVNIIDVEDRKPLQLIRRRTATRSVTDNQPIDRRTTLCRPVVEFYFRSEIIVVVVGAVS
jgi:hypothetical protein